MKKTLATILLVSILFYAMMAQAETVTAFDYNVLKNLDGYSYDKFEKSWSYYGAYGKQYSDAYLVIGLDVGGTDTEVTGVALYAWIRDENNKEKYTDIKEIMILADDVLITCPLLVMETSSTVYVTEKSEEMLKHIADAKELMFKIITPTTSITIEPTAMETAELRTAARVMYEHHLVKYSDSSLMNTVELMFPITIE